MKILKFTWNGEKYIKETQDYIHCPKCDLTQDVENSNEAAALHDAQVHDKPGKKSFTCNSGSKTIATYKEVSVSCLL